MPSRGDGGLGGLCEGRGAILVSCTLRAAWREVSSEKSGEPVDRRLVARLALPGMFGGAVGAYILAEVPGESIRPFVSAYLLVMGALLLWRATWKDKGDYGITKRAGALGAAGGFVATVGPSLWPIITGLVIGGGVAAPFAAYASKRLPDKAVMFFAGVIVMLLSLRGVAAALW